MVALLKPRWTPESYLAFERSSPFRHEYFNDDVYAMAGASENHNILVASMIYNLYGQLRKRPCQVYSESMRVKISPTRDYVYPDVVAVCGKPLLEDHHGDTLLNPTVILEVLSPSTADYDRGLKFQHYRTLESLQEYLLISQDQVRVEHYTRQGIGWFLTEATTLESVVTLASIECQLLLADLYEKVTFPDKD